MVPQGPAQPCRASQCCRGRMTRIHPGLTPASSHQWKQLQVVQCTPNTQHGVIYPLCKGGERNSSFPDPLGSKLRTCCSQQDGNSQRMDFCPVGGGGHFQQPQGKASEVSAQLCCRSTAEPGSQLQPGLSQRTAPQDSDHPLSLAKLPEVSPKSSAPHVLPQNTAHAAALLGRTHQPQVSDC